MILNQLPKGYSTPNRCQALDRLYPAHSVCRFTRHTECAGYFENTTLIDSPVLRSMLGRSGIS
jgi:hypothetical protein